jgi:broad specificity phosphatase PhoE
MSKLILIKHAKPLVDSQKPAESWKLSDDGRSAARLLAMQLTSQGLSIVVSSDEPKASETAQILASELKLSAQSHPDLHEHDRSNVPHMRSGEFISHVELLFRRPHEVVLGQESAAEALERFQRAIDEIVAKHPERNIAVVSHGTVIALFIEKHSDRNGFAIWREMSLPSFAVFGIPQMKLLEIRPHL